MPRLLPRFIAVALLAVAATSCASSGTKKPATPIPADNLHVLIETENALGISRARTIYLNNISSVPVVVTKITVMDCLNIRQYCGENKKNVRVAAGQRRPIITLQPDDIRQQFNYRFLYSWRRDGNTKDELGEMASAGDTQAATRLAALNHQDDVRKLNAAYGDKELTITELRKLGSSFVAIKADPDSVVIPIGSVFYVGQLRALALDKAGRVLGRLPQLSFTFPNNPAIRFTPPDTLRAMAPGTTRITMRMGSGFLADSLQAKAINSVVFTLIAR